MLQRKQNGFTLIELLVVIAIIGLLASIVLIALNSSRSKSRDAKRAGDVRNLMTALELYYNYNNGYPATLAALAPNYVSAAPTAPTPADGTCTAAQNTYTYTQTGSGSGYTLTFCLGGTVGSLGSGVHTASGSGLQ